MRRNKYNAIKVKADGITFDSKLEHKRYHELKFLAATSKISRLAVHIRFPLCTGLMMTDCIGHYEVDFVYDDGDRMVYEDCKGVIPALSAWKIKHFELQYDTKVRIIRK